MCVQACLRFSPPPFSLEQCTTALPEFDRNLRMPAREARRGDNAAAHRMIAHSLGRRAAQCQAAT